MGQHGGLPFVVLELVDGKSLNDNVGVNSLDWPALVLLMETVAQAVHVAHQDWHSGSGRSGSV